MQNRTWLYIGIALLIWGLLTLIGNLFNVRFSHLCLPAGLILLGLFLLLRPRLSPAGIEVNLKPFGGEKRSGSWILAPEEIWMFAGDIKYDLRQAEIPVGETKLRVFCFVGDIDLHVPPGIGVSTVCMSFITDADLPTYKKDSFLIPVEWSSPNYTSAERRIRLESFGFIQDIDIKIEG